MVSPDLPPRLTRPQPELADPFAGLPDLNPAPEAPTTPQGASQPSPAPPPPVQPPAPLPAFEGVHTPGDEATGVQIIRTDRDKRDGLDKCPTCGSADINYSLGSRALQCSSCRNVWNELNAVEQFNLDTDLQQLKGTVSGSGAGDITLDEATVTVKCQGCGAEVVIQVAHQLQARCHWCRQMLSLNTQIPNGAVPDAVLPFAVTHEEAVEAINSFVGKRKLFAWRKFKKEFTPENVVGVYMPYMIIDGNLSAEVRGVGEIQTRKYTVTTGSGDNKRSETRYDADVYSVGRKFDFTVDDLTVESSSERANMDTRANTNNIINTILPFDTKNAVLYNSNYLGRFTSERRDLDLSGMAPAVEQQFLSIARQEATNASPQYDRGVRWVTEGLNVHGTRWIAVYLPVWLYSYHVDTGDGVGFVHYIAVNGRNKETMGSVPVSHIKLSIASLAVAAGLFTPLMFLMNGGW